MRPWRIPIRTTGATDHGEFYLNNSDCVRWRTEAVRSALAVCHGCALQDCPPGSTRCRRDDLRQSASPVGVTESAAALGLALTTAHYYTPSGRLIQRPWDAAFDSRPDLTLRMRDQDANKPHSATDLKRTDFGRYDWRVAVALNPIAVSPVPVEGSTT